MTMATQSPTIDVAAVNPANGDKYSPNLYKWLKKFRQYNFGIYENSGASMFRGSLFIGSIDVPWFDGTHLRTVLCRGTKATMYAYVGAHLFKELPDFWPRYIEIGRCAIDTDHIQRFVGDDNRYVTVGDTRTCQWCGASQHLRRWQEVVEREQWEMSI